MIQGKGISAIILAGGKASRLKNIDKGLIEIEGKKIIERLIDALQPITNQILIISNNNQYDYLGLPVYQDIFKEKGPIGGIHTGLKHSSTECNFVVGCDMPFLSTELFKFMLNDAQNSNVSVACHHNHVEPLCGIYNNRNLTSIEENIQQENYKLMELLGLLGYKKSVIDEQLPFYSSNLFANINTAQDLETIRNKTNKT